MVIWYWADMQKCTLVWELRVVGWEVSYGAEYVPKNERGYTVIIQKTRRMLPTDEPVVSSSFNVTELGKILLTIDNPTTNKKKLVYRFKVLPCAGWWSSFVGSSEVEMCLVSFDLLVRNMFLGRANWCISIVVGQILILVPCFCVVYSHCFGDLFVPSKAILS